MTQDLDNIDSKPWIINPEKACYGLTSTKGYGIGNSGKTKYFTNLNSACDFASALYATQNGLPKGKYYLEWEIALRDKVHTRIYESKFGNFRIVAYII